MSRPAASLAGLLLTLACHPAGPRPAAPDLTPAAWRGVTRTLDSVIHDSAAPGAVLGVSLHGRHLSYGAGRLGLDDPTRPDSTTIYDLASLTKVIGLTTLTMLAVSEHRLDLDQPIAELLPAFGDAPDSASRRGDPATWRPEVTPRLLLLHASGLPAWRPLYRDTATRAEALALVDSTALDTVPGTRFLYSDLGAIVLTQVMEQTLGARIDSLFQRRIASPLGLADTRYLPPAAWRPRIAPTEDDPWRGRILRGEVHDENAARLDGVSGHAGLFGSARDLLRFGDWLLGLAAPACVVGDVVSIPIDPAVVQRFVRRQDLPEGSSRALGWDTPSGISSAGTLMSRRSFGHTGFTGTSIWLDPDRCLVVVLLSNRVHPTRENARWGPVRGLLADRVVAALAKSDLTR